LNPKPQQVIQVSKDSDFSLASSKNFSEILPHNGWHPGPGKVAKKSSTYDVTHKKTAPPKQKIFLECRLLDWLIRLSHWTAL